MSKKFILRRSRRGQPIYPGRFYAKRRGDGKPWCGATSSPALRAGEENYGRAVSQRGIGIVHLPQRLHSSAPIRRMAESPAARLRAGPYTAPCRNFRRLEPLFPPPRVETIAQVGRIGLVTGGGYGNLGKVSAASAAAQAEAITRRRCALRTAKPDSAETAIPSQRERMPET